jgi:hypothetical protein
VTALFIKPSSFSFTKHRLRSVSSVWRPTSPFSWWPPNTTSASKSLTHSVLTATLSMSQSTRLILERSFRRRTKTNMLKMPSRTSLHFPLQQKVVYRRLPQLKVVYHCRLRRRMFYPRQELYRLLKVQDRQASHQYFALELIPNLQAGPSHVRSALSPSKGGAS